MALILRFTVNQRMTILLSAHSKQMALTSSTLNQTFGGEHDISVTFSGKIEPEVIYLVGLTSTSIVGTLHGAVNAFGGLLLILPVNITKRTTSMIYVMRYDLLPPQNIITDRPPNYYVSRWSDILICYTFPRKFEVNIYICMFLLQTCTILNKHLIF
jgi:hypothetical protein